MSTVRSRRLLRTALLSGLVSVGGVSAAFAQPLGTFRWQLQPFCNVVTLAVTQTSSVFTLDGFDDQCGAATRAPAVGVAVPNPNGTIEIGLAIVSSPGAAPIHVAAPISAATLGGTWRDSLGNVGALLFNPEAPQGSPRPAGTLASQFPQGLSAGQITLLPDGGFAARGAEGTGTVPASGAGVRAMWHPAKAAFRAGRARDDEWDEAAIGLYSLAAGFNMSARGRASIALGEEGSAIGSNAVAIGSRAGADASFSLVLGTNVVARSVDTGAMMIGDHSSLGALLFSDAQNQLTVRAAGGYRFFTNAAATTGARLEPGSGAWSAASDVALKESFFDLDGDDVLSRLARVPIREWSYKTQDAAIRHVGPTAQDFHAAFGLGEDSRYIGTIDADGIALRAIQALDVRTRALDARNAALDAELAALRAQLAALLELRR